MGTRRLNLHKDKEYCNQYIIHAFEDLEIKALGYIYFTT